MPIFRGLAALALLLTVAACDSTSGTDCADGDVCYAYLASDAQGTPAVSGSVALTEEGAQVTGLWRTSRIGGGAVGPQIGLGEIVGRAEGSSITLTMVPNVGAGTVELVGVRTANGIEGEWSTPAATGGVLRGSFELIATGEQ